MEAVDFQPMEEDVVTMEEEEEEECEKTGEQNEASTTDEETDEDSEPEPPPVVRRKVSFADAFGLNLVSVKEFDNAEAESDVSRSNEMEVSHSLEEFYLSCLFTVPSSPEELDQRLQTQMVELEGIELLPGTTTLRGIIRVVNLCYTKFVYVRITMDRWKSYFDLLAEYVPGSSDRKTDRFTFQYFLVPPFEREGTRVEFCLRYETSVGTFWANNMGINYVLFCHQKGQIKEQMQEESCSYKSKRSCLKANRNGGAEDKTTATFTAEVEATHKAEKADRKRTDSLLYSEEHKPLVESIKNRHRTARLARVQDYFSQRRQQAAKTFPHDSVANGQKVSQPMPAPWGNTASFLFKSQKTQPTESPQVLTYHQIPLLTLDWNSDKLQQGGAAQVDDIWTGRVKKTLSKEENTPSFNDTWETFLRGTDDTGNKETCVCDTWQAFLNGPSCKDHSAVPESEWLQTAASVSPSNDKEAQSRYAASSQEFGEFQVGRDTPTTLHARTLATCQPLSDAPETVLANVTLNTKDHQPAQACVSSPTDDNTDASQRSQTDSVTDTTQEFSLKGAPPVSEDSVDSSAECHNQAVWEGERKGIIGGGIGADEPFTLHTDDLVTSSGESETTDMTAMPESQNATAADRISEGAARLDEGLSSSGEGEVTGTTHNAVDDMLAFRETIRHGTKDGARCVFSTPRLGAEEGSYREEEIFRPECELSPLTYADEDQNGANSLWKEEEEGDEDGVDLNEHCEEQNKEAPSNNTDKSDVQQQMSNTAVMLDKQSRETGEVQEKNSETGRRIVEQQEMNPSAQPSPIQDSREMKKGFQSDTSRSNPTDKCNPNPSEVIELRWTDSREDMKGQIENEGTVKENAAKKATSTEQQAEISERIKGNTSQEEEGTGKLKMEAMKELMGNVESPLGERKNARAELKEMSAEVESSPRVEYQKLKKAITPVKTTSLEEIGLMDVFVFPPHTDTTEVCHLSDFNDTCDSGVFSFIELPTDLEQSVPTRGDECSPKSTEQSHFEIQADLNSSAHLSQDHNRQSLTETSQTLSSLNDQENCSLIKETSVTGRQIEGFNRLSDKHLTSSSDKLKEPDGLVWWSKLYILSHTLRLLICGAFFIIVFLSDFPACLALYVFSLCWWIYKWRGHQVRTNKGMPG